jgi:hypothetical protein
LQFPGLAAQAIAREPRETNRSGMGMERGHSRAGYFAAGRSQLPGQTVSIPQPAYGARFASGPRHGRGDTAYFAGTPVIAPGRETWCQFSLFARFEGVDREPGIDGTLTKMVRGKDRWIWIIPITAKKTSIGVVLDAQTFKRMKLEPEEAYHQILQENPQVTEQLSRRFSYDFLPPLTRALFAIFQSR